jgi:hypothetical protein
MTLHVHGIYINQGDIYRVIDLHEFIGSTWAVCEHIDARGASTVCALPSVSGMFESTDAEWAAAVLRAETFRKELDAKRQARADAKRFGVAVTVSVGKHSDVHVHIVRTTATMFVDADGKQYKRKDGCIVGSGYFGGRPKIAADGLAGLAAFVGGRGKVDIVAERKQAHAMIVEEMAKP